MAKARSSGFTLIETVVAIVILAVAVPPMLWAVAQAQYKRANPMQASKARWLAVEKLEDIIADRHSESGNRGWDYLITANYSDEDPGDITGYPQYGYQGIRNMARLIETGLKHAARPRSRLFKEVLYGN